MTSPRGKSLKLSLAQWSIHRGLEDGIYRPEDFAAIAKGEFGITAVEYVNRFYKDQVANTGYWHRMRASADELGVTSLLIMVDDEGDLGNPETAARRQAVENHFKWVDIAQILGCHSIRINAFGEGTKADVQAAMVDALRALCAYAEKSGINVLIENHGLYSSDAVWITDIIQQVNRPNCGTLPDFGNWCLTTKWGSTENGKECGAAYDRYVGVAQLLPWARGVSAKSYAFDAQGNETLIDYLRLLRLVRDSDYTGAIGIEYEGTALSEPEGIRATARLVKKSWEALSAE